MFCSKCGKQIADDAMFCPGCGTPTVNNQANTQNAQANTQPGPQQYNAQQQTEKGTTASTEAVVDKIFDTEDHTGEYTPEDIKNGKVMSILCYLGFLVLIPMFAEKANKYVRFHVNQGFALFLLNLCVLIVDVIVGFIPVLGAIISALLFVCQLILMVLGIVNVANNKAKELPLIGSFKLVN